MVVRPTRGHLSLPLLRGNRFTPFPPPARLIRPDRRLYVEDAWRTVFNLTAAERAPPVAYKTNLVRRSFSDPVSWISVQFSDVLVCVALERFELEKSSDE